jgi:8-oxo-dGTP pyrophosphatase MutT (NUDIX family)
VSGCDRDTLVALLATHVPADDEERNDLERMRGYAVSLGAPCSREEPEAHFTASAIVVDETGERTMLIHHRKSGMWFQPGGHIETTDPSPAEAALREAREETGLDVRLASVRLFDADVHWIPWDEHWHLDLRFLVIASGTVAPDGAEVHAAEWVAWDAAFERIEETALVRALSKARAATG